MKPIYHNLRLYRRQTVFTQQDIAELLGRYNATQVSRHETYPVHPQVELGLLYEILFNVPFSSLFGSERKEIIRRLQKRVPNIIHELSCIALDGITAQKLHHLQN